LGSGGSFEIVVVGLREVVLEVLVAGAGVDVFSTIVDVGILDAVSDDCEQALTRRVIKLVKTNSRWAERSLLGLFSIFMTITEKFARTASLYA
jgi:hypothetical protein